jgi:transaldolase
MGLIEDIVIMLANYDFQAQVLVASVRGPRQVAEAAMMGADVATVPAAVLDKMYEHPLTDKGLAQFLSDWNKK